MPASHRSWIFLGTLTLILSAFAISMAAEVEPAGRMGNLDWQVPRRDWLQPFEKEQSIRFVNRSQSPGEWDQLPAFWNEVLEKAVHPRTGAEIERKAVVIKVPLGLTRNPVVPPENPMTVAKWKLGKELFYDGLLSSDGSISCSTCHDPRKGFTDQSPVSTGIRSLRGGMSAPTVLNTALNPLQFWDGRAASLEDQAQGPVQNPLEMFDGEGEPWNRTVLRVRAKSEYVRQMREVFGTLPTRDAIAKAIATYERTVLSGNSIHDRADLAMRYRAEEEGLGRFDFKAVDYETVLKEAFERKDVPALEALGLDPAKDQGKIKEMATSLNNGRAVFFGKARCNSCHAGDNFTDNDFHNLGVGVKDGKLPENLLGRYGAQVVGHKNPAMVGAFKTPTLRHLLGTAPFMHDGSEKTLEAVVEFYDRGGNANEFLDVKMRDFDAEKAYLLSKKNGTPYQGPEVHTFGPDQSPVVPLKLKLTAQEKKDLVLFLRALQGDPVDPIVGDPTIFPK